jgi:RNA polymerase sigma-70 factor (ECF subfamily)
MPELKKALIERLFAQQRTALHAFFYRRVRTRYDVPDLVQEVYMRMLRISDTDAIRNPEGYLYTVAHNLLTEQAVLEQRQNTRADFDQPLVQAELSKPPEYEELLDTQSRVKRLREVLAQLPPKCRAAVHMKYQHGLSYEEIARHLGVSTHMVQKHLGHALAHCRRRMARLR